MHNSKSFCCKITLNLSLQAICLISDATSLPLHGHHFTVLLSSFNIDFINTRLAWKGKSCKKFKILSLKYCKYQMLLNLLDIDNVSAMLQSQNKFVQSLLAHDQFASLVLFSFICPFLAQIRFVKRSPDHQILSVPLRHLTCKNVLVKMYFTYFAVTRQLSQEPEEFGVPKYNVIFLHVTKQQFGCKLLLI